MQLSKRRQYLQLWACQLRHADRLRGAGNNRANFANDDDFGTTWNANPAVKNPWYEIALDKDKPFNAVVITERKANITKYKLEYKENGVWKPIFSGENSSKIKIHRFDRVWGNGVRMLIENSATPVSIAEFGVFNERR